MTIELLQRFWALFAAGVLGTGILVFVLARLFAGTAQGQLRHHVHELQERYRELDKARRRVKRSEARFTRLRARAAKVKPRLLQEAEDALEDARSLVKIAGDQVMIAENHVRKVIVEEFPPARQERLRTRLLRSEAGDGKPFTFSQ